MLKDKNIYFYCPGINQPSGGIAVLIKQALILKEAGLNVSIIYNPMVIGKTQVGQSIYEEFNPTWLEFDYHSLKIIPLGKGSVITRSGNSMNCQGISISQNDCIIFPEGFGGLLRGSQNLPCKKVVLAQNHTYIFPSLPSGEKWTDYGVQYVVTISDSIKNFLHKFMPNIKVIRVHYSINTNTFTPREKKPLIIFHCRNDFVRKLLKTVIKIFYVQYPQYRHYEFEELKGLSRQQFAKKLGEARFALYNDEIAGLPTLPLEAMACHTHVVGWRSYGGSEYMTKNNGFWVENGDIIALGEEIGHVVDLYEKGQLNNEKLLKNYETTLAPFSEENEKREVIAAYQKIFS